MIKSVYFPGEMLLAVTRSHNEQHHVILAKSARGLASVYEELLLENSDTKMQTCARGRVVDLPPEHHAVVAERWQLWSSTQFFQDIAAKVGSYCRETGQLPPGTEACECADKNVYANFTVCVGAKPICGICMDTTFLVTGKSWDDIYASQCGSRAEYSLGDTDYSNLKVIYSDLGHHDSGTCLVGPEILSTCQPSMVKGFFVGEDIDIPLLVKNVKVVMQAKEFAKTQVRRLEQNRRHTLRQVAQVDKLAEIFGYSQEQIQQARSLFKGGDKLVIAD